MATRTSDESVAARTAAGTDDIGSLIRAYDRAFATARASDRVVCVRTRSPRRRRLDGLRRVLWPTWYLEAFVAWHVTRTLSALHRALSRRVATGSATPQDREDRDAVAAYRDAMPPVHSKTYLALVIVLTLAVGSLVLDQAGPVLSEVPVLKLAREYERGFVDAEPRPEQDVIEIREEASSLFASFGDAIGADVSSIGEAAEALAEAAPADTALVLASVLFSLYVVTRLLMPAYRRKRMLFNLVDDPAAMDFSTARWNVQNATGVYERERAVFERLDERPPGEPPLDLLIPLLFLSLPFALAGYLFVNTETVTFGTPYEYWLVGIPFAFPIALASGLVALSVLRAGWLWRTWRRRRGGSSCAPPFEVRLPGGSRATVRSPVGVAVLVYLVPYYLPAWWAIVNRHLSLVGPPSDHPRLYPTLSFLAFLRLPRAFLLPAAVSLALTRRRLHTVQRSLGLPPRSALRTVKTLLPLVLAGYVLILAPIPNISVLLAPLPTRLPIIDDGPDHSFTLVALGMLTSTSVLAFVAGYVQRRLNDVLDRCGERVPEGPGAHGA